MQNDRESARAYADFVRSFQSGARADSQTDSRAAAKEEAPATSTKKNGPPIKKTGLWLPPPSAAGNIQAMKPTPSATHGKMAAEKREPSREPLKPPPPPLRPLVASGRSGGPGREMDSLLAEIKAKQKVEEEKKNLKVKLESATGEERLSLSAEYNDKSAVLDALTSHGPCVNRDEVDRADPKGDTTNLYVSLLPPTASEESLCQIFSKFGKIISVKILYPRNEQELQPGRRNQTSGFVAFEFRHEAEAAKQELEGAEYQGVILKIGWGKPVPIPKTTAEVEKPDFSTLEHVHIEPIIDKRQKRIMDRLSKYVVQNGHPFEQLIMEREGREGDFGFLFQHDSPQNKYYRWRVYSLHQGDNFTTWRTEPFQLQVGGRVWVPPPCPHNEKRKTNFSNAAASASTAGHTSTSPRGKALDPRVQAPKHRETGSVYLSDKARDQLEDSLRSIAPARQSVCDLMSFCLNHAESAIEIADCLTESLTISTTTWDTKIARLYTVSDILHNSSSGRTKAAWAYRREFEKYLPKIFEHVGKCWQAVMDKVLSDQICDRVTRILKAWDEWSVFVPQFFKGLEASFHQLILPYRERVEKENSAPLRVKVEELEGQHFSQLEKISRSKGLPCNTSHLDAKDGQPLEEVKREWLLDRLVNYELYWSSKEAAQGVDGEALSDDLDGAPLDNTDLGSLDGMSLDGADPFEEKDDWIAITRWADRIKEVEEDDSSDDQRMADADEDVDGESMDGEPMDDEEKLLQNYVTDSDESGPSDADQGSPTPRAAPRMSAEERERMRKVELKVMQYQVELEGHGFDKEYIEEKCALKRKRMLAEMERESDSRKSSDDERGGGRKAAKKMKRERERVDKEKVERERRKEKEKEKEKVKEKEKEKVRKSEKERDEKGKKEKREEKKEKKKEKKEERKTEKDDDRDRRRKSDKEKDKSEQRKKDKDKDKERRRSRDREARKEKRSVSRGRDERSRSRRKKKSS